MSAPFENTPNTSLNNVTTSVNNTPVVSSWESKINWTQAVSGAAMALTLFGINLDPQTQAAVIATIAGVGQVTTWVLRTWFTKTLTAASVQK